MNHPCENHFGAYKNAAPGVRVKATKSECQADQDSTFFKALQLINSYIKM